MIFDTPLPADDALRTLLATGEDGCWLPLRDREGLWRAVARIDPHRVELGRWRWNLANYGYAKRKARDCTVHLHRVVLEPPPDLDVDHISRDPLDNREVNLRTASRAENNQNLGPRSASGIRGVSWRSDCRKWRAVVTLNGKKHRLGHFDDKYEAGRVAAAFRAQHMPFSADARTATTLETR